MTGVDPSELGVLSPEAVATQQLTQIANRLFNNPAVIRHDLDDLFVYDTLYLAVPRVGAISGEPTWLSPKRLTRTTSVEDGSASYAYHDDSGVGKGVKHTHWGTHDSVAFASDIEFLEPRDHGAADTLSVQEIADITHDLPNGTAYDPGRKIIIRGQDRDRLMGRGLLGKIGQLGVAARNIFNGTPQNPITYTR